MYSFKNDYSEGAHESILRALQNSSLEQNGAYGLDKYSQQAEQYIQKALECPDAAVHFLAGGTQTNMLAIHAWLRPHQAVISPDSGHIFVHEAGAIESCGHKVLAVPTVDGKLRVSDIECVLAEHTDEHMVQPKMVYISLSTELGTIYSKKELQELSACCRKHGLYFYMDGARLASALTCSENDLCFKDLALFFDAFYIGGTKGGALLGEALVICNKELQSDFRFLLKQKGAMLAKGFVVGVQFAELLRDGLYWRLGEHANAMATKIRLALVELGVEFLVESPTNQLFVIMPGEIVEKLQCAYDFKVLERYTDGKCLLRLVTSWATQEECVDEFVEFVKSLY